MSTNCLVCEKSDDTSTVAEDSILKLQNFIPELDWNVNFKLCVNCVQRLNSTYEFRNVCVESYQKWKCFFSETERIVDTEQSFKDEIKEEIDIDTIASNSTDREIEINGKDMKSSCGKRKILETVACDACGKKFLKNGLKKHHISCLKGKVLRSSANEAMMEDDLRVPPTCELCGTTFGNKYLLKRHIRNVHASEKKFKCEICHSAFVSSVYLNAHKRYHSGVRSHICSSCGKGFITASDLYHHEKIHANKRSYQCEKCPKAFNTSSDLHKHKICVHLERSKWKYVCTYCDKRFPLKTNLDSHLKTHTGERNYVCHLCDRKCINKSVLTRHIGTHSNIVSFKCDVCLQGYKYKRSLDIHLNKVHGFGESKCNKRSRTFSCGVCPKSYFDNGKLQKHMKTHSSHSEIELQSSFDVQI